MVSKNTKKLAACGKCANCHHVTENGELFGHQCHRKENSFGDQKLLFLKRQVCHHVTVFSLTASVCTSPCKVQSHFSAHTPWHKCATLSASTSSHTKFKRFFYGKECLKYWEKTVSLKKWKEKAFWWLIYMKNWALSDYEYDWITEFQNKNVDWYWYSKSK